jgi:signal transduction histidine kinase
MASLGALTAGIAHEIKNPLNFINNFASLLKELLDELEAEADPDEQRALLADLKTNASVIEAHGKRADDIVRSMMQHASGKSEERRSVLINELVEEYVTLAYQGKLALLPETNAAMELDVDKNAGELMIVGRDIGRVLVNLINNAFDAVSERADGGEAGYEPTIRIATSREAGQVVIRVSDNGSGISAEVEERVFEPFFTTKPTGQGTGLGLSLSYDIVTQGHGGTLTVESEEGVGSTFEVRLPI